MSVTSIHPLSGKDGEHGGITNRRASRRWLVKTNSRFDDETAVLAYGINNGFFPTPFWDWHPTWNGLLCRSMSAKQDEGAPQKWIAAAEYSSEPLSLLEQQIQFVPPLERPAKIRQRKSKYQKGQTKDINGKPYLNSAGDPVDPPIELPRGYPLYVITKNVAATPAAFMLDGDAINSYPFFIEDLYVAEYQARIDDWDRSDLQFENDIDGNLWEYYVLTWTIELNLFDVDPNTGGPGGWLVVYLDQGLRQLRYVAGVGVTNKRYNILDDSVPPQPITSPALLDGAGRTLTNPTTDTPKYITRHGYFEVDFNDFPLV